MADPADVIAQAIRDATDTELDNCLDDEDDCFDEKIHLGSQCDGVVRTVYATPEQIGKVAVAALAGRLLPAGAEEVSEDGHTWTASSGGIAVLACNCRPSDPCNLVVSHRRRVWVGTWEAVTE